MISRLLLLVAALFPLLVAAAPVTVSVSGADGKPLEGAIVTVEVAGAARTAPAGASAQVAQQGRQFVPQVTVVQVGTPVTFPNNDTVRHHVYSFSPIKMFELKLYAGTPSTPIVFDKPGTAVLGCNIHDKMAAWVVVVETPFFAKTDAAGQASIEVPAGEHRLRVWHPRQAEPVTPVDKMVKPGTAVKIQITAALT